MNKRTCFLPVLLVFFALLGAAAAPVFAQDNAPKPSLTISLQQDTVRANHPAAVTVLLANETNSDLTGLKLSVARPAFIGLYSDAAGTQPLPEQIDLGPLPAHSAMDAPKTLYLKVEPESAVSGSYNLLFNVSFHQGKQSGVVTDEKTLTVDLIGSETILGVPLAFAGFVLPGLMLLVALRWLKVPWAKDMSTEDRIIFGVIFSLLLLGPISLLARQAGSWRLIQWLDIQQEISIERLGAYIAIGLAFGLLAGAIYRDDARRKKAEEEAKLEALKFKDGDGAASLIWKGLKRNPPAGLAKQFFFEHRKDHSRIFGYHYARDEETIVIFPGFQLIASHLNGPLRNSILEAARPLDTFSSDPERMLKVADLLKNEDVDPITIVSPVREYLPNDAPGQVYQNRKSVIILAEDYLPRPYETKNSGCLLELLEDDPY